MIIYISGKMTGLPDLGRGAFEKAEELLRGLGYKVISPAWLKDDLPQSAYLPICMAMLDQADAVALLPGWESSDGAKIERKYALYQKKPVYLLAALEETAKTPIIGKVMGE